jgi:hypothetical protein
LADEEYKKLLANASKSVNLQNNFNPIRNKYSQPNLNEEGISNAELFQQLDLMTINQFKLPINNQEQNQIIISSSFNKGRNISNLKSKTKNKTIFWKHKRKKHLARYKQRKKIFDYSKWGICKQFKKVASCYHWN